MSRPTNVLAACAACLACALVAACPGRTKIDDGGDAGEGEGEGEGAGDNVQRFFYSDSTGGFKARVVDDVGEDGGEHITSEMVMSTAGIGFDYEVDSVEDLVLDVDGHLVTYDNKVRVVVPRGPYTRHVHADFAARTVLMTRPGSRFTKHIDGDEPWIVVAPTTTPIIAATAVSIPMARALKRVVAAPSATRLIVPLFSFDVPLGADLLPPDADDLTLQLSGTAYAFDAAFVQSVHANGLSLALTRRDGASDAELTTPLTTVDVDDAAEPELTIPDCDLSTIDATARELTVSTIGGDITAEIDVPASASPSAPAKVVVFNTGSEGGVRDDNVGGLLVFRCIVRDLLTQGIAVAIYDDNMHPDPALPQPFSVEDRDARTLAVSQALVAEIATDASIAGGTFELGHSEGATHASRVTHALSSDVAGLILVAGLGMDTLSAMEQQIGRPLANAGYPADVVDAKIEQFRPIFEGFRDNTEPDDASPDGKKTNLYFRQFFAIDGAADAVAAAKPTLVVQGLRDDLVVPENADAIEAALTAAGIEVDVVRIDDTGHLQMVSPDGAPGFGEEFGAPFPWDPRVTDAIATFVLAH